MTVEDKFLGVSQSGNVTPRVTERRRLGVILHAAKQQTAKNGNFWHGSKDATTQLVDLLQDPILGLARTGEFKETFELSGLDTRKSRWEKPGMFCCFYFFRDLPALVNWLSSCDMQAKKNHCAFAISPYHSERRIPNPKKRKPSPPELGSE